MIYSDGKSMKCEVIWVIWWILNVKNLLYEVWAHVGVWMIEAQFFMFIKNLYYVGCRLQIVCGINLIETKRLYGLRVAVYYDGISVKLAWMTGMRLLLGTSKVLSIYYTCWNLPSSSGKTGGVSWYCIVGGASNTVNHDANIQCMMIWT